MKSQKQWKDFSKSEKIAGVIVVAVLGIVIASVFSALIGGGDNEPKTTYEASINNYSVIDPATINVVVNVKNTGNQPGIPECSVHASNSSGSYKGYETFDWTKEVPAGGEDSIRGVVTITNEGAVFVDDVTVECE